MSITDTGENNIDINQYIIGQNESFCGRFHCDPRKDKQQRAKEDYITKVNQFLSKKCVNNT
jgi:hypothetical protein